MQSSAQTVSEYIKELPEDRKKQLNYYAKQLIKIYQQVLKKA
jgi:hypothetical protein